VPASLDELLANDVLDGLTERPLADVRSLRDDAQAIEGGLSFVRRMVHGRLDIVGAELERRRQGGDPSDLSDLVARLPELLVEHDRDTGAHRSPRLLEVAAVPDELAAELDQIVDTDALADLRTADVEALDAITGRLVEFERWVSERRRTVQDRLDQLQAEIVRRYRDGEASVDGLLA
jgi:hypothetical protein